MGCRFRPGYAGAKAQIEGADKVKKKLVWVLFFVGTFLLTLGNVDTFFLNAADESTDTTETSTSLTDATSTTSTSISEETSGTVESTTPSEEVESEVDTAGKDLSVTAATPEELVNNILGAGVTVSNVTYYGSPDSSGIFSGDSEIIGFSSGIVLSTGYAESIIGPNSIGVKSGYMDTDGSLDLSKLVGGIPTYDAVMLEFDFVATNDTLVFDYVFGSEEYPENIEKDYNDVFAFFLDGENIALTESGEIISVNTVNSEKNSDLYRDNTNGEINTEMDGLTRVLQISVDVNPGETHHIKLAIADTEDPYFDSNVFIKGASFSSSYLLFYDTDGGEGTVPDTEEYAVNGSATVSDFVPVKEGYKFTGWKSSADDKIYQAGDSVTMSSDVTLTAQWEEALTVVYDANGGTGEVPEAVILEIADKGKEIEVAEPTGLTRTDYKFVGWLSSADDKVYQPGDTITVDQNITLTAQWEATTTYTLTYDLNGGNGTIPAAVEYDPGEEVVVADGENLTKEGTYFTGWVSSVDGVAYQPGETIVMNQDITLIARWDGEEPPVTSGSTSDTTSGSTSDTTSGSSDTTGKSTDSSSSGVATGKTVTPSDDDYYDDGKLPTTGEFDDIGRSFIGLLLLGTFAMLVIKVNKRREV